MAEFVKGDPGGSLTHERELLGKALEDVQACIGVLGGCAEGIGKGLDGLPLVHCHAAIRTREGVVRGGHVVPTTSRIGARPIAVLVTSLDEFELRVAFDPETNIALMQPQPRAASPEVAHDD